MVYVIRKRDARRQKRIARTAERPADPVAAPAAGLLRRQPQRTQDAHVIRVPPAVKLWEWKSATAPRRVRTAFLVPRPMHAHPSAYQVIVRIGITTQTLASEGPPIQRVAAGAQRVICGGIVCALELLP